MIAIHDIANERVRLGVDAVRFAAWPKVAYVHLDWIPGQLFREPGLEHELWYGLGLVVVDASRSAYGNGEVFEQRYFPVAPLLADGRETLLAHPSRAGQAPRRRARRARGPALGARRRPRAGARPTSGRRSGSCARGAGG